MKIKIKNNLKETKSKEYDSKKFLLEFFKNAKIEDKQGVLIVSDVSVEFENFIGKKAPYKFVFDIDSHNKIKDSELIMQGSYFLLAIRDYLNDKGQTSLVKINIKPDFKLLEKSKLKGCKILESKEVFDLFYEFSFLSTYQSLNDKNQSITNVFVKGKDVIDIDIDKFSFQKGNKDELLALNPQEAYEKAKKVIDEKVNKEIKPIKISLKEKLEKELFRVKDHYFKQIKEKDEEVENCANKIKMLNSKLRHTTYWRDIDTIKRNIRESTERLEMLKKKSYKERLQTEEAFHINDEIEKHVLSIKNNLINLTVFYYPVYEMQVLFKGKKMIKKYDPVFDKVI